MKTITLDIIKIVSEFRFLFWLDNFEHINEKRIQFGETFPEEISYLCDELQNIWNSEHYSEHFESTLKICSDSINFIEGLQSHVKITDQSQTGSSSFNLSRSLTSTSTPKDIQTNNSLQLKQKSTLKPDKQSTSNLFRNQQNIDEDIDKQIDKQISERRLNNYSLTGIWRILQTKIHKIIIDNTIVNKKIGTEEPILLHQKKEKQQ